MKFSVHIKLLLILCIAFMFFTAIGTISHEYGHIMVAKFLGYETELHYSSMNYHSELEEKLLAIYQNHKKAIDHNLPFGQKTEYLEGQRTLQSNAMWIGLGGPLQTIATGTLGLLILLWRRKLIYAHGLKIIDWLAIFLSLFWLREVFNLVMSVSNELFSPNGSYFGGDEQYISLDLNLWEGTIPLILCALGLLISLWVIFKILPQQIRLTFIISGFIGGVLGYMLWMNVLGPRLIP